MAVQVGQPIIRTQGAHCARLLTRGGGIQARAPFPAARKRSFRRDPVCLAGRPGQPSYPPGRSGSCPIACLIARPMAHPHPAITTPQPFIPGLPSGPGLPLLALFERNRPAHTRDFQVASEQGVPARQPASSPALQTPAAPILRRNVLTGRAPDRRAGSAPRVTPPNPSGSAQPVPAEPVQPGLPTELQPTSQVRPPQAMLTLLTARQPETGSTGERAESQSFQGMLEQEWPLLTCPPPGNPARTAHPFGRRAGTAPHVARAGRPRPPDPAFAGSRGSR